MKRTRKKEKDKFALLLEEFNLKRSMNEEWKVVTNELKSVQRSMAKNETKGGSDEE